MFEREKSVLKATPDGQPKVSRKKNRLHLLYFLMAAFDLLTISGSLYLNHEIMQIYNNSLKSNEVWAARQAYFSYLGEIASSVNAPGNDIFETRNTSYEKKRLDKAMALFEKKYKKGEQDISQNIPPSESKDLLREMKIVQSAVYDMSESTIDIFKHFDLKDMITAGKNMAIMDRHYYLVTTHLALLASKIRTIQKLNFDEQVKIANQFKKYEYLIGGFILLMVCLALFYGNMIFKRFLEKEIEKNEDLDKIKQVSNALQHNQLLKDIAIISNQAKRQNEATQKCIDLICETIKWPVGHFYLVDKNSNRLTSTEIWHMENAEKFKVFKEVTEKTSFDIGVGLPGRVWGSGEPAWIVDITQDLNFPRAKIAVEIGVRGAFAFPIMVDKEIIAVMEFYSTLREEPNESLLDIMSSIGVQMGRVFERKQAENKLLDAHNNLESLVKMRTGELNFQKMAIDEHAIVSITDIKGNINYANDKFCHISGYSRDELMGKNHRILKSEEHPPEFYENMWKTISSGKPWHGDIKNKNKSEGHYWVRTTIIPNLNYDGKPFQYIGIRTEITESKNLEKQLILSKEEAEKANQAKSLFLANMSHEIRTPMNAILGFSQILLRKKDLDKDTKDALGTIDTSGKNLLAMINEILDISKIEAGKMKLNISDFDLKHLVDHLSKLFELRCQQKALEWNITEFANSVLVRGDEIKLQQTLVNLLGNAVKFTDSGKVELAVTPLDNNQFKFDVIDSGKGIPLEAQDKIFDAFQQDDQGEKKGGTGLGLAISKKQLELMGSDLLLKSEINKGAHFYFTLTLPPAEKEVLEDRGEKYRYVTHLAPECKVKALVVDDVKENRDVLAKLLSSIGVEIIEAENGQVAVEKVKEHLPDIVFMDLRMPVMGGEDATKLIIGEFGSDRIKIVAITASAFDRRRGYYIEMGFHEYISKPFKTEEIFKGLNELLGVEYVYDDDEISQEESSSIKELDLTRISIPEDLYERMMKSAESYSVTELERNLAELGQNSEVPGQLVEHLKQLLGKYDMEAILKVLESVSKTKA